MTVIPEHKHLIIRAEANNPPTSPAWVHSWLNHLVEKIGMKVCQGPVTAFVDVPGNRGVTGVVIIETSHIAIHVWDEGNPGLVQMDVYTCGPFDPNTIFNELGQFDLVKLEYKYFDREHNLEEVDIANITGG